MIMQLADGSWEMLSASLADTGLRDGCWASSMYRCCSILTYDKVINEHELQYLQAIYSAYLHFSSVIIY